MNKRRKDMRDQILQVALDLFTKQGYDKTSLREIAERLEVTKAALYYHFTSKEEMLSALVAGIPRMFDELIALGRKPAAIGRIAERNTAAPCRSDFRGAASGSAFRSGQQHRDRSGEGGRRVDARSIYSGTP